MYTYLTLKMYIIFIPILGLILLLINILLGAKEIYSEKLTPFECGFLSFNQSRIAFNVGFILVAILFLPFDLEISSILPYVLSMYNVNIYGLWISLIFILILVDGFIFEINKGALYIMKSYKNKIEKIDREM